MIQWIKNLFGIPVQINEKLYSLKSDKVRVEKGPQVLKLPADK